MFKHHWLKVFKFSQMHTNCPECGVRYEVEPGFFFGAMYISYAISVGIFLTTGFILYNFFGNPDTWVYIVTVPVVTFFLFPFMFRVSRILFLHGFGGIKYKPDATLKNH